jgi:hypothetical protein
MCNKDLEKGREDAAPAGDVRLVYVSQCVESESGCQPSVAVSRLLPPRSGDIAEQLAMPAASAGPTWTDLLQAAECGDEAETQSLAIRLPAELLTAPVIALAHEVLAGGPNATAKAVELAERLLAEQGLLVLPKERLR